MSKYIHLRRPHPFALGQLIGALTVGALTGVFFNPLAVMMFCLGLAAGAGISVLICRWRPGFEAASWKLWLVGTIANPLTLAALVYSASEYECLLGTRTGWHCMLVEIGPFIAALGCVPPIAGLLVRWWAQRPRLSSN